MSLKNMALTIIFFCLMSFRATESLIRVGLRNQIGINMGKVLFSQTTSLPWPYFISLESRDNHLSNSLIKRLASLPKLNSNDYMMIGLTELLESNWLASESNLQKAIILRPNNRVIAYWLGLVQFAQGNRQPAIANWEKSGALPYILMIGYAYMEDGLYSEAWEWYQVAVDLADFSGHAQVLNGGLALAYRNLGKMLWDQGQFEEAIDYYEKAVFDTPSRALYRYELSQLFVIEGRYDEAIRQIEVLLQIQPESASWPGVLGNVYLQAGELSLAEQALLKSLQTGNDENANDRCWHARSWYSLGIVYNLNQSWEASLNASLQAAQVNQGINPGWQNQLSLNFNEALAAEPGRMDWYLAIGDVYAATGDTQAAVTYYREAAQLWPDDNIIRDRITRIPDDQILAPGICP